MECNESVQSRKQWRKLVKKLQRKKRRQKAAQALQKIADEENQHLENNANYQEWLRQQEQLEAFELEALEKQREYANNQWLRRELIAQQQFRLELQRQQAEEAALEALREQQHKQLQEAEERRRKLLEEREKRAQQAAEEFERTLQVTQAYLDDDLLPIPEQLKQFAETNPTRKLCEFYERTSCCRYGFSCTFNHRRPLLSRIIVVRNFFKHALLQSPQLEYAKADAHLEISDVEMRADYDEFFDDIVCELEGFGKIINVRTVRNILNYLAGNVFVEYSEERAALRAFIKLQGRYYAGHRLNVEFSNIKDWNVAACGMSLGRHCPKGGMCNYLHLFRNPGKKYNTRISRTKEQRKASKTPTVNADCSCYTPSLINTSQLSWNEPDCSKRRTTAWRWSSMSPEREEFQNERVTFEHSKAKYQNIACRDKTRSTAENDQKAKRYNVSPVNATKSMLSSERSKERTNDRDRQHKSGRRSRSRNREMLDNKARKSREYSNKSKSSRSRDSNTRCSPHSRNRSSSP